MPKEAAAGAAGDEHDENPGAAGGDGDGGAAGGGDGDGGGEDLAAVVAGLRTSMQRLTAENKALKRQAAAAQASTDDDGDEDHDDDEDTAAKATEAATVEDLQKQLRRANRATRKAERELAKAKTTIGEGRATNATLRKQLLIGDVSAATGIENRKVLSALMRQVVDDKLVDEGPEDYETEESRGALVVQYRDAIKGTAPEFYVAQDSGGGRRGSPGVTPKGKKAGEKPDQSGGEVSIATATASIAEKLYGKKPKDD